jgi:hypothetical protein
MEIGRHRGMVANEHVKMGSNSYEKVKTFKHLSPLLTNWNSIQEEIKCRLKKGNSCYYSVKINKQTTQTRSGEFWCECRFSAQSAKMRANEATLALTCWRPSAEDTVTFFAGLDPGSLLSPSRASLRLLRAVVNISPQVCIYNWYLRPDPRVRAGLRPDDFIPTCPNFWRIINTSSTILSFTIFFFKIRIIHTSKST